MSVHMHTKLSPETIKAYRDAIYMVDSAPPIEFNVDVRSAPLEKLLKTRNADTAAWITAYNPYGKKQTLETNKTLQKNLLEIVGNKELGYITGRGMSSEDGEDREEGLLLFNLLRNEAIEIGNLVNQNAIIWIDVDGIPMLELLV